MAATMSLSSPVSRTLAGGQTSRTLLGGHVSGERIALRQTQVQQIGILKQATVAPRASKPIARMQEGETEDSNGIFLTAKKVAVAAAAAVLLSMPAANVSPAFAFGSATDILTSAKKAADDAGAKASSAASKAVGDAAGEAAKSKVGEAVKSKSGEALKPVGQDLGGAPPPPAKSAPPLAPGKTQTGAQQLVAKAEDASTTSPGTGKQQELTNTRPTYGE